MPTMEEVRSALESGATRQELLDAGFSGSSITKARQQLKKGAGDGRRQSAVRTAKVPPGGQSPALSAPSSELSDMREQVQLVKLGNDLAVAKQQAVRLQPETPEPPNEISNARAMIGLFSDLKTLFPAPETPVSTPAAEGSKLSSVQLLNLDIARMEMEERQLVREEERALQQVEQKAELVKEVGGHVSAGLSKFLGVLQEVKAATPARVPDVRAPALNPKAPALEVGSSGRMIQSSPGVWTRPIPPNTDVVPSEEIMLKPLDRPGGTWIGAADAETGEVISWAWAADPPPETVRERLQRIRLAGGIEPRPVVQVLRSS